MNMKNEYVDIKFSAHEASLDQPSLVKIFESKIIVISWGAIN